MQNRTDAELLQDFAATHSEAAFSEIVRRYADAVYSAALRQVGNEHQARDVAQTVFVDLARKATSLKPNTLLIGWLHRGARLAALEFLRTEQRRFNREQQAMELHDSSPETEGDWSAVRPVLDEAIANLGDEDRNALLLRFFKNESLSSVGTTLGVSEDAAQKRVSRALDKLRNFLAERGIKTTAAALAVTLAANSIQSAPSGFAASLAIGALTKAAVVGTATPSFLNLSTLSNMKTTLLGLALVGSLVGITAVKVQSQHALREAQTLIQRQAAEMETLRSTNEQLAGQTQELADSRDQARDVLRLRAEVTRLLRERSAQKPSLEETALPEKNDSTNALAPRILLKGKFVMIPTEALKALSSLGMPTLGSGLITTLTEQQSKDIGEALDGANDVDILSKPQIITSSGTQAAIAVGQSIPWGNTNAQVGITLKINPLWTAPTFNLGVVARLMQLVDNSKDQDGSQQVLESVEIPANVSLLPNQTVILVKDISKEGISGFSDSTNSVAGPKTLLVFVTPSVFYGDRVEPGVRLNEIVRKADTNSVGDMANPIP